MKKPQLVIMAAGLGSRFGGLKQMAPVDPQNHWIIDYSIFDAVRAGFGDIILIVKPENEQLFRDTLGKRIGGAANIIYVHQRPEILPAGFSVPEGRVKPWGTAHAVLCAKDVIDAPFSVINADDFYGKDSFKIIHDYLVSDHPADEYAMVGYQVENTLTENGHVARGVDFMIVRENTEGMYIADEESYTDEGAIARRIITKEAESRIIDYAFNYALENNKNKVTAVHKANVLKKTDGLFKEIFYEVAEKYPNIATEDFYVDATAMYLVTQPESFEVIVTTNLFGDILSDEGAGLVGGLGLIPSANIGEDGALFEPVHGSAPDIAGQGKANPIAMMLSAIMMLRYLGENEAADKFDAAILKVLNDGNVLTGDLGGTASTMELAQAVKNNLIN